MKRLHRRFHLIVWPLIGLAGALGLLAALQNRPADPRTDLPAAAVGAP